MIFGWFRSKPDPQLEAMKEKVARADQKIEEADTALSEAIRKTNSAYGRLEKRTAVVKHRIELDERFLADLGDGLGNRHD